MTQTAKANTITVHSRINGSADICVLFMVDLRCGLPRRLKIIKTKDNFNLLSQRLDFAGCTQLLLKFHSKSIQIVFTPLALSVLCLNFLRNVVRSSYFGGY